MERGFCFPAGPAMMSPVARNLGSAALSTSALSSPSSPARAGAPPTAVRARRPGWRDPRLGVGVVLVAGSVLGGARLLAAADDTVGVWALAADAPAGAEVASDDLVVRQVRFADAEGLADYFRTDEPLPGSLRLLRPVGEGELLPRGAVGEATESGLVEVPLGVEPERVPGSVRAGSVVDVYVSAPGQKVAADGAALVSVSVVDAPAMADSFGTSGLRQVVLAVPEEQARRFFALVGSLQTPAITVVRRA